MKYLLVAASLSLGAYTSAYSFYGDWTLHHQAQMDIQLNSTFGGGTINIPNNSDDLVTATQSSSAAFSFPYSIMGLSAFGDFDVNGDHLSDLNHAQTTGPITYNSLQLRFVVPEFFVTGTVSDVSIYNEVYGLKVIGVNGDATTVSGIGVQARVSGNWVPAGTGVLSLTSWSMTRPVPEPASMLVLSAGVAALIRRRRNS